jgi:hypothetical protein
MIWNNLAGNSNYDIIQIVEGISSGALEYDLEDLKNLNHEIVARRLAPSYSAIITDKMQGLLKSGRANYEALKKELVGANRAATSNFDIAPEAMSYSTEGKGDTTV